MCRLGFNEIFAKNHYQHRREDKTRADLETRQRQRQETTTKGKEKIKSGDEGKESERQRGKQ